MSSNYGQQIKDIIDYIKESKVKIKQKDLEKYIKVYNVLKKIENKPYYKRQLLQKFNDDDIKSIYNAIKEAEEAKAKEAKEAKKKEAEENFGKKRRRKHKFGRDEQPIEDKLKELQKDNPNLISINVKGEDDSLKFKKRDFNMDTNIPIKEVVILDKDYVVHELLEIYDDHCFTKIDFLNSIVEKYKDKIDVLKGDIEDLKPEDKEEENKNENQIKVIERDIQKLRSERDEKLEESFEISVPLEPAVKLRMERFINKQKDKASNVLKKKIEHVRKPKKSYEILAKNLKSLGIRKKKSYSGYEKNPPNYDPSVAQHYLDSETYDRLNDLAGGFGKRRQRKFGKLDSVQDQQRERMELTKVLKKKAEEAMDTGFLIKKTIDPDKVKSIIDSVPHEATQKMLLNKLSKKMQHGEPSSLTDLSNKINKETKELTQNTNDIFKQVKNLINRINDKDKRILELKISYYRNKK